jgi:transposase-like protein
MSIVPRPYPKEFRGDVVAVARRGDAPISQIARDFGITESCLRNWLHGADVEDGARPGRTAAESAELRELKRRNRLLEQENEVLRRAAAYLSQASLPK